MFCHPSLRGSTVYIIPTHLCLSVGVFRLRNQEMVERVDSRPPPSAPRRHVLGHHRRSRFHLRRATRIHSPIGHELCQHEDFRVEGRIGAAPRVALTRRPILVCRRGEICNEFRNRCIASGEKDECCWLLLIIVADCCG